MHLTEINIFPIKSMGGIRLQEAEVLPAGLKYDRRWLLLNENGRFMTQRHWPEMARIKFEWQENGFSANYLDSNFSPAFIPFEIPETEIKVEQVWDDKVQAREMSKEINNWFSDIFKSKCRLVRIVENAVRHSLKGDPDKISSFADITPFLIIGENSLADLNSRLDTPLPMSRFRSNFIFSGGAAFEEDDWDEFTIGTISFKKYKKCGRCKVTTIDQETGEKMGDEPLNTLSQYRKEGKNMNFGIRAFLNQNNTENKIKINDTISVQSIDQ